VADELEDAPRDGAFEAEDLHALCWRAIARSSGGCVDGESDAAAAALRAEVVRAYASALDLGGIPSGGYDVDGVRHAVAGLRGYRAGW